MKITFAQSKEEVVKLCQYFEVNQKTLLASNVKEAHIRQLLIDPFFEALGWDVRNAARTAPQYREVVPEDSLDVEGQNKAPDYSFRVGQTLKFYAEAKKCSININIDPESALQIRRYGWSAKISLSLLTNFKELCVYDCTLRPRQRDKSSHARIFHFRFDEYPDHWQEIWDIFSREAVWSGAFDNYAASKRKRGTSEVDKEFLKEIEGWRDSLARNFALRNKMLSTDDLNSVVQLTIDRVIFLRMAEDRRLEPEQQLLKLCERDKIYSRFMSELCRKADDKYNSGLFHFKKENRVSENPDITTPRLILDDKVFKPILQSLYFAYGSPYHFGVLPVEILGTVYERFLGKIIRLTSGHQAKVENKPERSKKSGIYYTPKYIVDFIVSQTVGKQIKGKSPAQLAKHPFRVLDMACGSGSFLLGAYQHLLDYYLGWYVANKPENHKKAVYQNGLDRWRLTIGEKKRILTTHIFGVDIDRQAVEVSKLSLLLKVLEGENDQTMSIQLSLFVERVLPNLSGNIKCGNSLISPKHIESELIHNADELNQINPFDWNHEFPQAMKAGGFDCVIGNPPYVRIQNLSNEIAGYLSANYQSAVGKYDIYLPFVEAGLRRINSTGKLGFILPNKFFTADYGQGLRSVLVKKKVLDRIVDFQDAQIFENATTYTALLFLTRKSAKGEWITADDSPQKQLQEIDSGTPTWMPLPKLPVDGKPWYLTNPGAQDLLNKLNGTPFRPLRDVANRVFQGLISGADKLLYLNVDDARKLKIERDLLHPVLKGKDVRRYTIDNCKSVCLYPYILDDGDTKLLSEIELRRSYPMAYSYLSSVRPQLEARGSVNMEYSTWYAYWCERDMAALMSSKILTQVLAKGSKLAFDESGEFFFVGGGNAGVYGITIPDRLQHDGYSYHYVLALLNSKVVQWVIQQISTRFCGGYYSYAKRFIEHVPLASPSSPNASHLDSLVTTMLIYHQRIASAKSDREKSVTQRLIESTDREIDKLVYDLYGLTAREIAIVEGEVKCRNRDSNRN